MILLSADSKFTLVQRLIRFTHPNRMRVLIKSHLRSLISSLIIEHILSHVQHHGGTLPCTSVYNILEVLFMELNFIWFDILKCSCPRSLSLSPSVLCAAA